MELTPLTKSKFRKKNTLGQRNYQLWHSERIKRLTASGFGKICKLRSTTNCAATVKNLLHSNFMGNKSTQYGIEKEPIAIRESEGKFNYKVVVRDCGLFVDKKDFYLAASPDGIIGKIL